MVLSYDAWPNIFEGRPDIIGTKVMVRGYPMEVIGVAKAGFSQGWGMCHEISGLP